jgi:hypothetical protein
VNLYNLLTSQPKTHPVFSYGFLAVILALLFLDVSWRISLPSSYPYHRNMNLVVALMLLLNHLAFQFRLPPTATALLRIMAICWLGFALYYIVAFGRPGLH